MNGLQKILDLIKKTGDRLVVLETESETPFVVMTLDDYEKLIRPRSNIGALSEGELLDKINQDIARWRAQQDSEEDDWLREKEEMMPVGTGLRPDWPFESDAEHFGQEDLFGDLSAESVKEEKEKIPEDQYYFEPVEA